MHTISSRSLLLGTPVKFAEKVPLFFLADQGVRSSKITLCATGYFLQKVGLVPSDSGVLDEVPWLLIFRSAPGPTADVSVL